MSNIKKKGEEVIDESNKVCNFINIDWFLRSWKIFRLKFSIIKYLINYLKNEVHRDNFIEFYI